MRCWRCTERDEHTELGLCAQCADDLRRENLIPPGRTLHPPGTLPEDIKPYVPPPPGAYRTTPQCGYSDEAASVLTAWRTANR